MQEKVPWPCKNSFIDQSCSVKIALELISIMPSLAASLNGELVFLFSVQKLLFVQDFRSILLQETHLSVFSVVFSQD